MNKENIYRIIGYQGEYSPSVKKAIKKLLKQYHPDCNGNSEIFQLINEVKKELETNQVKYKYDTSSKSNLEDIDYEYCRLMLHKNEKEQAKLNSELKVKYQEQEKLNLIYRDLYHQKIGEATSLDNNHKVLEKMKINLLCLIVLLIIVFLLAIIKNNMIIFITFGVMCFATILIILKYFKTFDEISKKKTKKLKKYENTINEIKKITVKKQKLLNDVLNIERKLKNVENDLRFYNNLLK